MKTDEIADKLRGLIAYADETYRAAGLAAIFPSRELRALSRISDELERIVAELVQPEHLDVNEIKRMEGAPEIVARRVELFQCETCKGSGNVAYEPCTDCYGTGEVPHGTEAQTFAESRTEWLRKYGDKS